jgi:catechol 2,3-dioxygenase-like lactoylglutathione lyase family enzyme
VVRERKSTTPFARKEEVKVVPIQRLHHAAYRCRDAAETVKFYTEIMELEYAMAAAEDRVPSVKEETPFMHIFFRMKDGGYVAFFELPQSPDMGRDENTPEWVQHLALSVESEEEMMRFKEKIDRAGIEITGPIDHKICRSIYFFDPNGHRLEITFDTTSPKMAEHLSQVAIPMLDEWSATKKAPKESNWNNDELFS